MSDLTEKSIRSITKAAPDLTPQQAAQAMQAEIAGQNRDGALDALWEAHRAALVELLNTPAGVPAEAEQATGTVVGNIPGLLTVIGVDQIVTKWGSVNNSPTFYVDFYGKNAEYLASRAVGDKWGLADGTWRVKCPNRVHATVIADQARKLIIQEGYEDHKVVIHAKLDPAALLHDATREGGAGATEHPYFHAVGVAGLTGTVTAYHDADGKLVGVEIT